MICKLTHASIGIGTGVYALDVRSWERFVFVIRIYCT